MVIFEDIAAPLLLLMHVSTIILGVVVWLLGIITTVLTIRTGKSEDMRKMTSMILVLGGIVLGVSVFFAGLIYPSFQINVRGGPLGLDATFPYASFLFDLKQWIVAVAAFAVVGAVAFSSGQKSRLYVTLALSLLVLTLTLIVAYISIYITAIKAV